jgi:hypothetical protein
VRAERRDRGIGLAHALAMQRPATRHTVPVLRFGVLTALCVVMLCPRVSAAQDLTSIALSARAAVARAVIDTPQADQASASAPVSSEYGHISFVMQSLYATTVVVQGLDAQSTFKALAAGAVESNSLVKPLASNRPAFIALKAGMSAAFIYAGHDLSKRHKIGAILALGLINSAYTAIALHNYHVAHAMETHR